jgi:molybdopterin-guanine dinucleotide biosynthesis protein A
MVMDYFIGILAGGQSQRFGSPKMIWIPDIIKEVALVSLIPKSILISLHSEDQLCLIVDLFNKETQIIRLNDLQWEINIRKEKIPIEIIFDDPSLLKSDNRAAIFGLYTILQKIQEGFIQIIPCDTPYFDSTIMNQLILKSQKNEWDYDALIPKWENGYIESLNSIYCVETMKDRMKHNINRKIFKLGSLFDEKLFQIEYFSIETNLKATDPEYRAFKNINTKNDLK